MEIVIETVDMAAIVIEVNNDVTEQLTGVPTSNLAKNLKVKKAKKIVKVCFHFS